MSRNSYSAARNVVLLQRAFKNRQLFGKEEEHAPQGQGANGGVGIFLDKEIPAVWGAAYHGQEGQRIRVTCASFHIYSVSRRPNLNVGQGQRFDARLGEDMVALGETPCIALGDFNADPAYVQRVRRID